LGEPRAQSFSDYSIAGDENVELIAKFLRDHRVA
jgi:hypothetical protein